MFGDASKKSECFLFNLRQILYQTDKVKVDDKWYGNIEQFNKLVKLAFSYALHEEVLTKEIIIRNKPNYAKNDKT